MKNFFLILTAFFQILTLKGQITYGADDFIEIGDEIIYTRALNIEIANVFEQNGPNQIWDYSQLTSIGSDTISYFDPNESGYQFYYCFSNGFFLNCQSKFDELTNIAELGIDSFNLGDFNAQNITRHYKLTEDKFAETMIGVTAQLEGIDVPVSIDFEEEDVILRFPLKYQNKDTSKSLFELDLSPVGFNVGIKRQRTRATEVEGYGRLITPSKTYEDVLKVKSVITNVDTTFLDSLSIPFTSMEVEYRWFAKEEKGPVLIASGLIVGGSEVISNVQYMGSPPTSIVKELKQEDLAFYPNPFQFNLQINSNIQENFDLTIYDLLGRPVFVQSNLSTKDQLGLDQLEPGSYFFHLRFSDREERILPMTKVLY